jgi:hypothetical protein
MVIGNKFWPIYGTADYLPADNPGVLFGGTSSGSTITGVSSSIITNIAGLLSAGATVGISGNYIEPGTQALSAVGSTVTLSKPVGANLAIPNLRFWDARRPSSAGGDSPIQAVLCLDSTHATFAFTDATGNTVTIPGSTLAKGAVYYFQIGSVSTVTAGDFIGYAAN